MLQTLAMTSYNREKCKHRLYRWNLKHMDLSEWKPLLISPEDALLQLVWTLESLRWTQPLPAERGWWWDQLCKDHAFRHHMGCAWSNCMHSFWWKPVNRCRTHIRLNSMTTDARKVVLLTSHFGSSIDYPALVSKLDTSFCTKHICKFKTNG